MRCRVDAADRKDYGRSAEHRIVVRLRIVTNWRYAGLAAAARHKRYASFDLSIKRQANRLAGASLESV